MPEQLQAGEPHAQKRRSGKSWAGNLGLLVATLTLGGLFSELLIRFTIKDRIVLFPRYHTEAHYGDYTLRRLRPSSVFWHTSADGRWKFVTNAQGFRDTEAYTYQKRAGLYRVICLGDSNTEGFECRQDRTYCAVLQRFLRREGIDAQVMNTGVSGFGTAEELAFLENEGLKFKPDVVVVGLAGNDFEDNIKSGLYALEGQRLVSQSKAHVPGVGVLNLLNAVPPLRWLGENSYLYSGAMNAVWDAAKLALLSRAQARLRTEFVVATEGVSDYQQALMTCLLERMYQVCAKRGIRMIILDIPAARDSGLVSAIPVGMLGPLRASSDALVLSEDVLGEYRGLAEFHVLHGQRHISEFTHLMLGLRTGRLILRTLEGASMTTASVAG